MYFYLKDDMFSLQGHYDKYFYNLFIIIQFLIICYLKLKHGIIGHL